MTKRSFYEKFCEGDNLSNEEITEAIGDFEAAEKALSKLGICFQIQRKACSHILVDLRNISAARGLDKPTDSVKSAPRP